MSKIRHFAFKQDNQSLCHRLLTEAQIFNISNDSSKKGIKVTALWDTGATGSAITPFENKTDHYEKALAVNRRNKV